MPNTPLGSQGPPTGTPTIYGAPAPMPNIPLGSLPPSTGTPTIYGAPAPAPATAPAPPEVPDYGFPEGLGYAPWQLLQALFPYLSQGPNLALQMALAQFGERGAMGRTMLGEQGATGRAMIGQMGALKQLAAQQGFQSQTQGIQNRFQLANMMGSGRLRDFMAGRQFMHGGPQPQNAFPGGMGGLYPKPYTAPSGWGGGGFGMPSLGNIGDIFGGIYGGLPEGLQNPASPFDFGGGGGQAQSARFPGPAPWEPGYEGTLNTDPYPVHPQGYAKGTPGAGFGVWVGEAGPEILKFSDNNEFEGVIPIRGGAQFGMQVKQPKSRKPQLSFGQPTQLGATSTKVATPQAPAFGATQGQAAPTPYAPPPPFSLPALTTAQTGVMPPAWGPMQPITLEMPTAQPLVVGGQGLGQIPGHQMRIDPNTGEYYVAPHDEPFRTALSDTGAQLPTPEWPFSPPYPLPPGPTGAQLPAPEWPFSPPYPLPQGRTAQLPSSPTPRPDWPLPGPQGSEARIPLPDYPFSPPWPQRPSQGPVLGEDTIFLRMENGQRVPVSLEDALAGMRAQQPAAPETITIPPPHQAAGMLRGNPVELQDYMDLLSASLGPWAPQWAQYVMRQATPGWRQSGFRGYGF